MIGLHRRLDLPRYDAAEPAAIDGSAGCLAVPSPAVPSGRMGSVAALCKLAKPGIVSAEVMAALAGLQLAAAPEPLPAAGLSILPAIALTAAGAAMANGILDASADRLMPRLAARSLALESVGPERLRQVALLLMGSGLALAAGFAPLSAVVLLAAGCFGYVWLYTVRCKRRSPWGVLVGGVPGALPPLIGAAAVGAPAAPAPLLLALFIFLWQLPHFWLLALHCRDQYARAAIPVLPLTHGEPLTKGLTLALVLLLLPTALLLGAVAAMPAAYSLTALTTGSLFALFCGRCLYVTRAYRRGFVASLAYLLIILAAICLQPLLAGSGFCCW